MPPSPDIARLLNRLDRELWIVTAADGPRRGGLVATFVGSASIVPELPRMLVGIGRRHFTWELVERTERLALHLFPESRLEWVWQFGLQSGRHVDKFAGIELQPRSDGPPLLADALGWLDCRVEHRMETGDRTVYLAEVLDGRLQDEHSSPLTMPRMLELLPQDKRQELKRQLDHDASLDAAAIRDWRSRQENNP